MGFCSKSCVVFHSEESLLRILNEHHSRFSSQVFAVCDSWGLRIQVGKRVSVNFVFVSSTFVRICYLARRRVVGARSGSVESILVVF